MANKFLSKKIIISAVIIFGGLFVAAGVLFLPSILDIAPLAAGQNPQWTQQTGAGLSAPACSASANFNTCANGYPVIQISTDPCTEHQPPTTEVAIWVSGIQMDISQGYVLVSSTCNQTVEWSAAVPRVINSSGNPSPQPPQANHSYAWDTAAPSQHNVPFSTGNFTTPNCAPPPLPTTDIKADGSNGPITIPYDSEVTISWSSTDTTSCTVSPDGWTGTSGSRSSGDLTSSKTYLLSCTGPGGDASDSVVVNVLPPPPGDFNLSLGGGLACNSVPLSWTASTGADGYRILKGAARVDITPYNPYTALNFTDTSVVQNTGYLYQIEAYNVAGTNRSNALNVTTPYCPPTLNFSGDPATIYEGQNSTLNWSSTYTTSCTASGAWSGSKALNDSEIVIPLPPPSITYNLQCSGPGGTTLVQPVIINITPLGLPNWREIIPR